MKSFIAIALVLLAGTVGAGEFKLSESDLTRLTATTFHADTYSFATSKNTCLKLSFGENKFSVCGIDNAGKTMVDDCETIGFVHAWKVEETMVRKEGWSPGPEGTFLQYSYETKRTRRCLNCTVHEEEYNEVTPKWRRK